jgi:phosphoribosylformylglycinamidine synthase
LALLRDVGYAVEGVTTVRSYQIEGPADSLPVLVDRLLANDAVERAVVGRLAMDRLGESTAYVFELLTVNMRGIDDEALIDLSRRGQLSLSLAELRTIQAHFEGLGREPTDCELETIAQTWSEHCSHKTLRGPDFLRGTDDRQLAQGDDLSRDEGARLRLAGECFQR